MQHKDRGNIDPVEPKQIKIVPTVQDLSM